MSFTVIDGVILLIFVAGGIVVALKGFFAELGSKASYFIGFLVSMMFTRCLAYFVANSLDIQQMLPVSLITFLVLFYIGFLLCRVLANVLTKAIEGVKLEVINKTLGFFLGIIEAFVCISLVLYILRFQTHFNLTNVLNNSFMYTRIFEPIYDWISRAGIVDQISQSIGT